MEISGGDNEVVVRANGGVVRGGVDFSVENVFHILEGVLHRSVYLRNAAERIRILHVCFGFFDDLTTSEKLGDASRRIELSLVRSHRMNSMVERFYPPIVGIKRQRRDAIRPLA